MDDYQLYKIYMALKLHFTTESYNIVKFGGRTSVTKQSYESNHSMVPTMKKLSRRLKTPDKAIEFFMSNLVAGDINAGVFDPDAEDIYIKWKGRQESITYKFETDLLTIIDECGNIEDINKTSGFNHPPLLKLYLQQKICPETMVLLTNFSDYRKNYDVNLKKDLIWRKVSLIIRKYKPFVKYNKERIEGVYRNHRTVREAVAQY